ncbi:MAG: hypothetical protein AB1428_13515 [Bacteroidota bacterium]
MYAINHAATALLLKRKFPTAKMIWLLISVQLIELLWVAFNLLGIEYFSVRDSVIHLDYLPWSHSVLSTVSLALIAWLIVSKGFKNKPLGVAVAIGILSHVVLDIFMHEPDIALTPFAGYVFGLNIQSFPLLTIIVETGYGVFCWWYFKGNRALLIAIVALNLANIPTIFNVSPALNDFFDKMPFILPTVILAQILYTWYFVWRFSRQPAEAAGMTA